MAGRVVRGRGSATSHYELKEVIGSGGMGTVYRAIDLQLHREVALKVLGSVDDEHLERFLREREITALLDHPNFVRILTFGYLDDDGDGRPFYTMPLIRGLTLEQLVHRRLDADSTGERLRGEYTLARLLQLMQQICLTIQSAHDRRVLHRDLKPANIIVGPYGDVYVTDLGLAKRLEDPGETTRYKAHLLQVVAPAAPGLTEDTALGTPYYMAPEQILNPRAVSMRSDIYGLGGILYFVMTGCRPRYVEPEIQRDELLNRKHDLEIQLKACGIAAPSQEATAIAPVPVADLLREFHDVEALLLGSRYHELRLIMQRCEIIPPSRVLAEEDAVYDSIDPALEAICLKALARDPSDRYETCDAMWRELQQYLDGRRDIILKRRGRELARDTSRAALPQAMRSYEQAERRLAEVITEQESVGRIGIEDRLDLFDVLLGKARLHERLGDDDAILRTMGRAEPMVEATLAVIERQFIQVLVLKGIAKHRAGQFASAREVLARAARFALDRGHADLRLQANYRLGAAALREILGAPSPAAHEAGYAAIECARRLADELAADPERVRCRIVLARLQIADDRMPEAWAQLEEALVLAGTDSARLAEVYVGLAAWHLRECAWERAAATARTAADHADASESASPGAEARLLLGCALHGAGDAAGCLRALRSVGASDPVTARELARFCTTHELDPAGLERGDAPAVRWDSKPQPSA